MRLRQLIFTVVCLGLGLLGLSGRVDADPDVFEDQPTTLIYPPFWHTPLGIHRGTPEMLSLFVGSRTRLDRPQALACSRLLSDVGVENPEPAFCLTVIGANTGQGHLIYNPSLTSLEVIGDSKNAPGLFRQPAGVAMTPHGTVFVADPGLNQVLRLDLAAGRLEANGALTPPPGGWIRPWGVAVDSRNSIYVTDQGSNQIHRYRPEGTWQASYGPELGSGIRLQRPAAIAVADPSEPWSFYHDAFFYVVDSDGQRLIRTDHHGRFQCEVKPSVGLPYPNSPAAFAWAALDYYENVWVTDPIRSQVHKLDRNLLYLDSYGEFGNGDRKFTRPSGIAIFRHFGQVFIADEQSAHYFWVGADVRDARAAWDAAAPGLLRIDFFLTEPAAVTISIRGKKDALFHHPRMNSGPQAVRVNAGKNFREEAVIFITVEATYSSARYFAKRVRVIVKKL